MTTTQTTDTPPLDGMLFLEGVWVTSVGEDGSLLVAGHHPLEQTVAAMNSYSRQVLGLLNLADDAAMDLDDIAPAINERWATRLTYDDCDERAAEIAAGLTHVCAMCGALDDDNWWITVHNDQRPGSFPVMWMSA